MTWFDRIRVHHLVFDQEIKKMAEGIQPPVHRGGSSSLMMLVIDKPINITVRYLVHGPIDRGKKQLQIQGIVVECMF